MKHKVLLINPPESGRGEYSTPPLGLLYIAGTLKANGIEADLVDGYIAGWDGVEKRIHAYHPTIASITCHTYSRNKALKVAEMVKRFDPRTLVVFGGAHATIMYDQLLTHYPHVDIAVRGEGERTFLEICQGKDKSSIDGIAYRDGSRVVATKERKLADNLDDFPFPAWDLIDIKRYPSEGSGVVNGIDLAKVPCVPVVFSRGCIGSCIFCCYKLIWKRWRHRSPKNMADELELLYKEHGAKHINFNDDFFTGDKKAVIELCDEIVRRGIKIAFQIVSRTDFITEDVLDALKRAGCHKISFGIESASPELLKRMKKQAETATAEKAIALTRSKGITAAALLIAGNIGETRHTINETIDFLHRVQPDEIGLANGLRILPGTALYDYAKALGFIDDDFWLSDYHWKIFTAEHSKTRLNIFHDALARKKKLSKHAVADIVQFRRFYWKALEDCFKAGLKKVGIRRKKRKGKYEIAY